MGKTRKLSAHQKMLATNYKYGTEGLKKTFGFLVGETPGEVAATVALGGAGKVAKGAWKLGKKTYKTYKAFKAAKNAQNKKVKSDKRKISTRKIKGN
jgi:hypothetical protein